MAENYNGRGKSISTRRSVSGQGIINVNTHLLHPWGDIKIVSLASPDWRQPVLDIKGENDPHNADIAPGILQAHDYANVFIITSFSIPTSFAILRFRPPP